MSARKILIFTVAILLSFTAVSGQNVRQDPKIISTGPKLAPRSGILPYASRDAAILQSRDSTDYIIPLDNWKSERISDGTRYTARFKIPYVWHDRSIIFRNTGASSSYSVSLNGIEAGYSQLSAGRTEFDLTRLATEDYNTITVTVYDDAVAGKVENARPSGSGIGDAAIIVPPKVYVKDFDITTSFDDAGRGRLEFGVVMQNSLLNPKEFTVYYELISPEGEILDTSSRKFTANPKSQETVWFGTTVNDIKVWNHEAPYLYTVVVKTQHEGRFKEYVAQRIGFRTIDYRDGQIYLNGKPLPVVTYEYSWSGDERQVRNDLASFKQQGINCIVVKGAPQKDLFYAICDELGLYVVDQAAIDASGQPRSREKGGTPGNDPAWLDSYVARAEQMYWSSRLHPSVIGFSIARNSSNGFCLQESYMALKLIGDNRPVTYPEADGEWNSDPVKTAVRDNGGQPPVILENTAPGMVTVRNNRMFGDIRGTMTYGIRKGKNIKQAVTIPVNLAAGQSAEVAIPVKAGKSAEAGILIEVPGDYSYVPGGGHQGSSAIIFDGSVKVAN